MMAPDDPRNALERALHREKTAVVELEKLVHKRTHEVALALQRVKKQSYLIAARTAIALLAQHGTLERAAPRLLEALGKELGWQIVQLFMIDPATNTMRCKLQWGSPEVQTPDLLAAEIDPDGLPKQIWATAKPGWITAGGLSAACAFPIIVDNTVHAIIQLFAMEARDR